VRSNEFIDKIDFTCAHSEQFNRGISSYVYFDRMGNNVERVSLFVKQYPFLETGYIEFLKGYNGLRLGWCDFLSLDNTSFPTIVEYLELLQEWEFHPGYIPFAKDAAGAMYCFSRERQGIWYFDVEHFLEEPTYIVSSFEEFINDCVLGKRYGEFSFIENNPFYEFLKTQGWV